MSQLTKFQCHYRLTLLYEDNGEQKQTIVTDPVSINFNVSKVMFQSYNNAVITIYNLDRETRECIYQDKLLLDESNHKYISLEAGYGDSLTLICFGRIQQCFSERVGTDMITNIEVIDPDILTQYTSVTFKEGTAFDEAYKYLASQLPNLKQGEVGAFDKKFLSPTTFEGNSFWALNQLTGGHTFIDNGVIHSLNNNEVLSNFGAYLISSETGLLGTPKRYDAVLEITMLFEPTLRMGQLVEILSETQARFNGQYKIVGITHNCTISGSEAGSRITTIQLLYLEYLTNSNINLTNKPQGSSPAAVVNNKVETLNVKISSSAKDIYNYIKSNNGKLPSASKRINSLVSWVDMLGHNNTNSERMSDLTLAKTAACEGIADRVLEFINKYYAGNKIKVTSGWRSVANNQREGGVSNSQHLTGRAIDFKVIGVSASKVASMAKSSGMFRYVKSYSTWVHVDVRA